MITVKHGEFVHRVPCCKCGFCLQAKRSSWMFRIHHEMKNQNLPGYFVTMTYNEKCVKRTEAGLSLRFRDVQLYFKRLRRDKYQCKYICVGEYGAATHRPHYHLLLWTDCPAEKLNSYWYSQKDHKQSLGDFHMGNLNMRSAMYTLKYIIQPKQREENGIEKTRAQFSRGLGINYLTTAVYDYHTMDYENPIHFSYIDGKKVALPRYYKNKIFTKYQLRLNTHKIKWQTIRERRKQMRKLIKKGIPDASKYMKRIAIINAERIISKTKYKQTL